MSKRRNNYETFKGRQAIQRKDIHVIRVFEQNILREEIFAGIHFRGFRGIFI